jgi:histidinol-phosphate aminotransferase
MPIQPRPSLTSLAPVVHGGLDPLELERLGLSSEQLIDFSVSTNPLGPAPAALAAARAAELGRYPDRHNLALRRALGAEFGLPIDRLLIGNGSAELIWLLSLAYLQPGDRAFLLEPTFGEYRAAAKLLGAELTEWRASPADDFRVDATAVAAALANARPRLAFLCNPNNPTGTWLTRPELELLLGALPDGLLVVDEAYLELAGRDSPAAPLLDAPNLVLLRSMTKDYGLPGLRLGYAVSSAAVIRALGAAQPPWSVNAAAQAAGLAALGAAAHVEAGRRAAAEARAYLEPRLTALGYRCLPSTANFWLIEVPDAPTFRQTLLRAGIQVRDCSSFGLPNYIRLAARPLPECERLIGALERLPTPVDSARPT